MPHYASEFQRLMAYLKGRSPETNRSTGDCCFCALFCVLLAVCSPIWSQIRHKRSPNYAPRHIIWLILLLNVYYSLSVHGEIAKADVKTFGKWSLIVIRLILKVKIVILILFYSLLLFDF